MMVLSLCWRRSGDKPFEAFGKDSGVAQKAEARDDGPTGPATSISPAMVRLLRPSVQLPAGTCGIARVIRILAGMASERAVIRPNLPDRRVGAMPNIRHPSPPTLTYLFVQHTNIRGRRAHGRGNRARDADRRSKTCGAGDPHGGAQDA